MTFRITNLRAYTRKINFLSVSEVTVWGIPSEFVDVECVIKL